MKATYKKGLPPTPQYESSAAVRDGKGSRLATSRLSDREPRNVDALPNRQYGSRMNGAALTDSWPFQIRVGNGHAQPSTGCEKKFFKYFLFNIKKLKTKTAKTGAAVNFTHLSKGKKSSTLNLVEKFTHYCQLFYGLFFHGLMLMFENQPIRRHTHLSIGRIFNN